MPPIGGNPKPKPKPKYAVPPSPAGDRPQTHGTTKVKQVTRKPPSPAGDRPQTHGPTGSARPASPAGDRPQTHGTTRRAPRPVSPAGDRPQTHGPTGTFRPASPAGDRPQTHGGADKYKASRPYRAALRDAYKAQSLPERRQIAAKVLANHLANRDADAILRAHTQRSVEDARARALLGHTRHRFEFSFADVPHLPHIVSGPTQATGEADAEKAFRKGGALPEHTDAYRGEHPYKAASQLDKAVSGALPGLIKSGGALVEGTYRDPIGVPTKTAKQAALATAALPAGLVNTVVHPADTAKAVVDDYAHRNSESYDAKLARVRKEGGLPEASDIVAALSLGGGAAAKTALMRNAPERAAKVLSGGARKIPKKGGPVRYVVGTRVDSRKAARYEKIAARAEAGKGPGLSALQNEALQANRAAGRVVAVVPRKSGRKMAKVVAQARGKAVAALKYDSAKGPFAKLAKERFNLNKHEAKALWLGTEVGIRDAGTARKVAGMLRERMAKQRGDYTPHGWERDMDVIAQIDDILKDPEKHFTPNFAAVMDRLHEHAQEISKHEPQFKAETKETRRRAVQAFALDLERGVIPSSDRGEQLIREHGGIKEAIKATHPDRGGNADDFRDVRQAAARQGEREAAVKIADGEARLAQMKPGTQAYEHLKEQVNGYYTAQDRHRADQLRTPSELRYAPETDPEFNARIDAEAKKAGLSAPTYFRSEKQQGLETDFGAHAVGGNGPKSAGKQYQGKNLGQGIFDTTYDQFVRGYAHNIKATHNYPLIAKLDEDNRLRSFSPDDKPQGDVLGDLMNKVNRAEPRLDKGSVVFVNKGLFRKALEDGPDSSQHATANESMDADAEHALQQSVIKDVESTTPELLKTPGWVAWPKEALHELEAELHHGSLGGRALDVAKGSASKAILLTANVPWLVLQAASEGFVTGVASKGRALTPRNMVGTARWWKEMNHRQRTHVATELGLGATGSDTQAIKLGATTNNHLVNAWRDLKAADFWHRPRVAGQPVATIISPVKWMRAADQGKTNVTRLLLAHSELTKKIAPERQSSLAGALVHMTKFGKSADRLLPVFKKPSAEQLKFLHDNPHLLEQMGDSVSTALGDWTSLTAKERKVANRVIMFYPFVRYSTRLLLHTLPVDHPAVTAVLAELGQLTANEYREVFGDDDLPWNIGKVYFGKTGESKYIDLSRANPATNAVVTALTRLGTKSSNAPGAAVGMLPPYAQWLIDDATGVNTFKGRPQKLEGDTAPFWNPAWKRGPDVVGKLAVSQVSSLFYPAREAMTRLHPETQSDESSLLFPTPMKYKSSKDIKGNSEDAKIRRRVAQGAETNEAFAKKNAGGVADVLLGPLLPKPSRDKAASEERQYVDKLKAAQDKKAAERKAYRDSHGGKNKPSPRKPKAFGAHGGAKPFGSK